MKKILFIYNKEFVARSLGDRCSRGWIDDCRKIYNIKMWGKGYSENIDLSALEREIDKFKPDYIYSTIRKIHEKWLPDLTNIKVPKIFVEDDNLGYNYDDSWYKQFDVLLCRCPWWNNWEKIPLFRWSVPEIAFSFDSKDIKKSGIYFIGSYGLKIYHKKPPKHLYAQREKMRKMFRNKITFMMKRGNDYWKVLGRASCLICPTENGFGDYVPAKLYEYSASGAAVLTNCNLKRENLSDLDEVVIKYTSLEDLKDKLNIDFSKHYRKAQEVIRNHTHRIRYKELFR